MADEEKNVKVKKSVVFAALIAVCIIAGGFYVAAQKLRQETPKTSSLSSAAVSKTSASATVSFSSSETALGGLLMLVNKEHPLPQSYTPNFVSVPSSYYYSTDKDNRFDERAAPYLESFIDAARAAGYNVCIVSGYRSYQYQQENYTRHVNDLEAKGETSSQAQIDAANVVAPPGMSEHETGLAADIITSDWYNTHTDLTSDFDQTPAFAWLYAHCADYGFILRYLKNKTAITQYEYEPWHYRFVGVDNAKKIMASGLCLEEYLNQK